MNVGDRIGDYEVLAILGAGGMGKVYKVRHVISDRVEAMKVLLPNLEGDPELADRFMREIRVQASLDHPNIAGLHTAHRVGNQILMVIEYVEGQSLESLMRNGPLPLGHAIDYMCQVLTALEYAHARGIIHRDIKPANMMLAPKGVMKLMDFGIARLTSGEQRLTQTGRTVGSLYYMSPEQIRGELNLDARADLYSVGVSLYELVTGRRPFQGDSEYSIMAAHLASTPVPPIQLDPSLPPALNEIILMSIAKEPGKRFQSAAAFRAALDSVQRGAGVPAAAPKTQAIAAEVAPSGAPASGSRRALYMVLGSVLTIGVLVIAGIQVPKWKQAGAVSSPPAEIQSPPASQQPVEAPATEPAKPEPAAPKPQAPARQAPVNPTPVNQAPVNQAPVNQAPPPSTVQVQQPVGPPADPVPVRQPPPTPSTSDEAPRLRAELRERLMMLATRIGSTKPSLQTLRNSQARSGLTLRGDITAAEQALEYQMDQAESAIKSGDFEAAKRSLDLAERELEKIEKFLGR